MRIAVIGAGIVGVSSAYELAEDGHEVTVFERHSSVAGEASFANGGVIAPGHVAPWAAPGMPSRLLRDCFGKDPLMRVRPTLDVARWRWLWRWWRASRAAAYQQHRGELLRLTQYSRDRLRDLSTRLKFEFERTQGLLVLLRTDQDVAAAQSALALLRELGTPFREVDRAACHALEPGMNRDQALAGGIHFAQAEAGNCRQFAHLLREAAERLNVEFHFGTVVKAISPGEGGQGPRVQVEQMALTTGFVSSRAGPNNAPATQTTAHRARAAARYLDPVSQEHFDAVVIAAGADAGDLLAPLGLRLPIQPLYGYSLTAPLRSPERGPKAALIDERHQVTFSRLGQRVRVAGGAELGGSLERHRRGGVEALYRRLDDWFPGAAHIAKPQVWKGARPMLPDGPPLVGPAPQAGVWLNLGHGHAGWALACGSARLLADLIGGRKPAFDPAALDVGRYRAASRG
ncbi:FAD-dependent oxidoreductase [uncultured Methylibium sp.]|uniref:FAD-dependent oxidoreductase n=1 Tax=uncultured Methylibium sp. TaxID=381093 RepID=UPI0025EFD75E|nr:FAD-dependent oxidoreductase [uncultured Methylibium sp.]